MPDLAITLEQDAPIEDVCVLGAAAASAGSGWTPTPSRRRTSNLKLGFTEFGRLDDFPPGYARHFMMKRLD